MVPSIDVREFGDYRSFLWAYAQWKKGQSPRWSLGSWAKRLGLKNTSSISKVLKGQRHIGPDITNKLIRYFDFSEKEHRYFEDLVRLSKLSTKNPDLSHFLVERVLHSKAKDTRILDLTGFRLFSSWVSFALREMVLLADFEEDPKWIKKRLLFPVNESFIVQTLRDLEEVGLLKRNSKKRLVQADDYVATTQDKASLAIRRYHQTSLEIAKEALEQISLLEREFQALTFVASSRDIDKFKKLIREFKDSVLYSKKNKAGPQEVFQLQIQFFPLSKKEIRS